MEAVFFCPRGEPRLVQHITTGLRPYLLLTVLCALLFLPGLTSIPPTDRDEARFMQATKQMLKTGDVVSIRFQGDLRTKKPVGIHWLQYLSVKYVADGDLTAAWAYRLPSVLAAWLTVLGVFLAGRRLFDAQAGLLAATLTASTVILMIEAHLAKTDALLLLTVVIAQTSLLEFYRTDPSQPPGLKTVVIFWFAVGLGLLIKGPIICAILFATILMLGLIDRNIGWLRGLQPEIGVPIALAFVLPWILATAAAGHGDVLMASLAEDFIPKLLGGTEGHGAPPGTHLALAPITLWPASLILLPGLIVAWQQRNDRRIRYALAWAAATWLMFELAPTKLPHYILPAVPALALAVAGAWRSSEPSTARWNTIVWCLVALILTATLLWASWTYNGALAPGFILAVFVVTALGLLLRGKVSEVFVPPALACAFALCAFSGVLPNLSDLNLSERLKASVSAHAARQSPPVALSQYHEPSAVFALGTETWLTNARNSAAHIAADPMAMAGVSPDQLQDVIEMVTAVGGTVVVIDRVSGFNYSKGRAEQIILIRSETLEPAP